MCRLSDFASQRQNQDRLPKYSTRLTFQSCSLNQRWLEPCVVEESLLGSKHNSMLPLDRVHISWEKVELWSLCRLNRCVDQLQRRWRDSTKVQQPTSSLQAGWSSRHFALMLTS